MSLLLSQLNRSTEHDAIVRRVALAFQTQGVPFVRADIFGYDSPGKISWTNTGDGHIPDIVAGDFVVEVETSDSYDSDHTKSQCELFSAYCQQHNKIFVLVVPTGYKVLAETQLILWGIQGTVWQA